MTEPTEPKRRVYLGRFTTEEVLHSKEVQQLLDELPPDTVGSIKIDNSSPVLPSAFRRRKR